MHWDDYGDVLTVEELAKALRFSKQHIYQLVRVEAVPHFRVGNHIRFHKKALIEWVEAGGSKDAM